MAEQRDPLRPTSAPRVLLVQTGSTHPDIVARDGDYDDWFVRNSPEGIAWTRVRAFAGEALPDPAGFDGVLVTGSPLSVRDEAPWMSALGTWMVAAVAHTPVLAVCFGHQLVGEALGGRVGLSPAGRELGTTPVELSEAGRVDPLFSGLPPVLQVQQTHGDALLSPPSAPGVVHLAGNAHTQWQAFAWGPRLRAVQFHPEVEPAVLGRLLATRDQQAELRESEHGRAILANWARHWLGLGAPGATADAGEEAPG